jgi:hypothetical protein
MRASRRYSQDNGQRCCGAYSRHFAESTSQKSIDAPLQRRRIQVLRHRPGKRHGRADECAAHHLASTQRRSRARR